MELNKTFNFKDVCKGYAEDCIAQLPNENELECDLSPEMQDRIFMEVLGKPHIAQAVQPGKRRIKIAAIIAAILAAAVAIAIFAAAVTQYKVNGSVLEFGNDCALIYPDETYTPLADITADPQIAVPSGYELIDVRSFDSGVLEAKYSCKGGDVEVLAANSRNAVIVIDYCGGVETSDCGAGKVFLWKNNSSNHALLLDGKTVWDIRGNLTEDELIDFAEAQI